MEITQSDYPPLGDVIPFRVGCWIQYLPGWRSSQWGVVIALRPCNHLPGLFPIGCFDTGQIRFISGDFAQVVSRSQVPIPIIRRLASFAENALQGEAFRRERELFHRPRSRVETPKVYPVVSPRPKVTTLTEPKGVSTAQRQKRSRGAKALLEALEIEAQASGIEGYGAEVLRQLRQKR